MKWSAAPWPARPPKAIRLQSTANGQAVFRRSGWGGEELSPADTPAIHDWPRPRERHHPARSEGLAAPRGDRLRARLLRAARSVQRERNVCELEARARRAAHARLQDPDRQHIRQVLRGAADRGRRAADRSGGAIRAAAARAAGRLPGHGLRAYRRSGTDQPRHAAARSRQRRGSKKKVDERITEPLPDVPPPTSPPK